MKKMKKALMSFLLVMTMLGGLCIPHTQVEAASVKVKYAGAYSKYAKRKNYIYVNKKRISITKEPTFMKEGSYMGPAKKIFKSSKLKVGYKESSNHKKLTLTYKGHVLQMNSGSRVAVLDGQITEFGTAPLYGKYRHSGYKRWIVPLKSVCTRLGIQYSANKKGVITLKGAVNSATTPAPENSSTEKKEETSQGKVVLVLDAGHGGSAPGASSNGVVEKDLTLSIVLAAKKYFDKDSRFKVYYTRTTDSNPSLESRAALAGKVKADAFISVHINSYTESSNGSETLYDANRVKATKKNGLDCLQLAAAMQKVLVASTGFRNRGLVNRCSCDACRKKYANSICVLRENTVPACLLEYGFITNAKERNLMKANTSKYGKDLYDGFVSFMKSQGRIK